MARRVLCLTSNFPRWEGDSTTPFVLHLAQDLGAEGYEVDVLAPHAPGASKDEIVGGIRVRRFQYAVPEAAQTVCYQGGALVNLRKRPFEKLKLPALVAAELAATLSLLHEEKYDLIHSHWLLPQGFVGGLASRLVGIPHVVTIHGGDLFSLKGRLLSSFKRRALDLADAVTVNSSFTERETRSLRPSLTNLSVIPMGVLDTPLDDEELRKARELRERHSGDPLVVTLGRLVEEKGMGDVIDAMPSLVGEFPGIRLLVVGEGQDRARFEARVSSLSLGANVTFTGWIAPREVRSYLAAADVFVGASKRASDGWVEAQGLTFLEAMVAGAPVVGTRSGGIVDSVVHGESGLLVSESSPHEIGAAIENLHTDPELRKRLVACASTKVRAFSRRESARRFASLFERLVEERVS